jgi:hypothetical protein
MVLLRIEPEPVLAMKMPDPIAKSSETTFPRIRLPVISGAASEIHIAPPNVLYWFVGSTAVFRMIALFLMVTDDCPEKMPPPAIIA